MNVLIGFEESQTVCKAFRELGINAFSCDLKPCSGGRPDWHLQMDIYQAINMRKWDFIGLHPVCTKMTLSGNRHYSPGKEKHKERIESVEWTVKLWQYSVSVCGRVYMENPMGAMNGDIRLPKPQIIFYPSVHTVVVTPRGYPIDCLIDGQALGPAPTPPFV